MNQMRAIIQKVELADGGLLVEAFIPYPQQPTPPADLAKATEEEKGKYHAALVAAYERHDQVERVRPGEAMIGQEDRTRGNIWKENEEDAWEDYQVSRGEAFHAAAEEEAGQE